MTTEAEADKAAGWLRDNAAKAGKAAAMREYMAEWKKVVLANVMREQQGMSNAAAETAARCDRRYAEALEAEREAIEQDVEMRWLKTAAEAKIELYRTRSANERAEGKAY